MHKYRGPIVGGRSGEHFQSMCSSRSPLYDAARGRGGSRGRPHASGSPRKTSERARAVNTVKNRAHLLWRSCLPLCCSISQIWLAAFYLVLYAVYVTVVFTGPKGGGGGAALSTVSSQDGVEVGGFSSGLDDHAVDARWM